jgi:APA family basic amino acid/polyamine antiporter
MLWNQLFLRKSIEQLHKEMLGENRLRRVLGPISLTALGVGAIIGSGIFVTTGETAANKAGPGVMISYAVAGLGCALAALCYAEFASMAPVAGSAYTYAYATLGELFAWIIGWDLVLEYAMSCGVLAADWTKYFNVFLDVIFHWHIPEEFSNDPISTPGAFFSVPAVVIMALSTIVLVIGIRESATTNAILVITKVGVVVFVIGVGCWYINPVNWTGIPPKYRKLSDVPDLLAHRPDIAALLPNKNDPYLSGKDLVESHPQVVDMVASSVEDQIKSLDDVRQLNERPDLALYLPAKLVVNLANEPTKNGTEFLAMPEVKDSIHKTAERDLRKLPSQEDKWGAIGLLGLNRSIEAVDDRIRSPFLPYGISGILAAAAAVFFAYIGFDAISTHSEEAKKPQRDVPFGILASLGLCSVLYFGVSAVITGMEPYPVIDPEAAVAEAFNRLSIRHDSLALRLSALLIATGALAGMTSVILITMLSQARIFLAMARDGLLPANVFGAIHPTFRTPHLSTMLTGGILCVVTALTPIDTLFNMVNIGTLLAFSIVCAAVLLLRMRRPDAERPFRCPGVYFVAPLGVGVNLLMMLFLPLDTWVRLIGWLLIGFVIYFGYGYRQTLLGQEAWALENENNPAALAAGYFRSATYRRRLDLGLIFCCFLALAAIAGSAYIGMLWWKEQLVVPMALCKPLTAFLFSIGICLFLGFMAVSNFLEWNKARAS